MDWKLKIRFPFWCCITGHTVKYQKSAYMLRLWGHEINLICNLEMLAYSWHVCCFVCFSFNSFCGFIIHGRGWRQFRKLTLRRWRIWINIFAEFSRTRIQQTLFFTTMRALTQFCNTGGNHQSRFDCILPNPPYGPDLATSGFHLFGPFKMHFVGQGL